MRTLIHRLADGPQRTVQVVAKPITPGRAAVICRELGLPITADLDYDGGVHLRPRSRVSTADEVLALRAFAAVTDAPLAWHAPDTSWGGA